jgi:hypothetical protein
MSISTQKPSLYKNTTTNITEKQHRSQIFNNFHEIKHSLHNHHNQILGVSVTQNLTIIQYKYSIYCYHTLYLVHTHTHLHKRLDIAIFSLSILTNSYK